MIALTFDDAPGNNPEAMHALLDALSDLEVKATFCCTTDTIQGSPGRQAGRPQAAGSSSGFVESLWASSRRSFQAARRASGAWAADGRPGDEEGGQAAAAGAVASAEQVRPMLRGHEPGDQAGRQAGHQAGHQATEAGAGPPGSEARGPQGEQPDA